jgi:DNA-binding NarL/FixJ family response regulator
MRTCRQWPNVMGAMEGGERRLRVLVVDDEEYWRGAVSAAVSRLHDRLELVRPDGCSTAMEAMHLFTDEAEPPIDLVILDLGLPYRRRDDYEPSYDEGKVLGEWIAEHSEDTRIIVLTENTPHTAITLSASFTEIVLEKEFLSRENGRPLTEAIEAALADGEYQAARDIALHRRRLIDRYRFTSTEMQLLPMF